ncbi:hypothetical protein GJAV_G00205080 [Gymnothorax javanicus]|nr:hypothetical protein GJAV_G00205080 [Gymnothorax javanicus]
MTQRLRFQLDSLDPVSFNCPEENDETETEGNSPSITPTELPSTGPSDLQPPRGRMVGGFQPNGELFQSLPTRAFFPRLHANPAGYDPSTLYPSTGCPSTLDPLKDAWLHPSLASSFSGSPCSLPASLPSRGYPSFPVAGLYPPKGCQSLPGRCSPSLEQPASLHSNPLNFAPPHSCYLCPLPCQPPGLSCYSRCPVEGFEVGHLPHRGHLQGPHHPHHPSGRYPCAPEAVSSQSAHPHLNKKISAGSAPLSLEHRKVFVTYEADSDRHVNEIIKFVALLRHNGFDTRIDMFEQQFRSISKIDFMEKFISEKEYLIIIVISPKYYETVTGHMTLENDERTLNTVYIHKQLQNEFIQNGSRNFRFIPVLFPGAKKGHVPPWLLNTHVYSWPRDRDDILRRLMRVEKYNAPPVGQLPTIVSVPL